MLLNLKPGGDLQKTIKVWKEAMRQVIQANGQKLGFSIMVQPLTVFLPAPEWDEEPSKRWQRIDPEDRINDSSATEQTSQRRTLLTMLLPGNYEGKTA
jgi:hypothetical protein